jgi:hypothetical protein
MSNPSGAEAHVPTVGARSAAALEVAGREASVVGPRWDTAAIPEPDGTRSAFGRTFPVAPVGVATKGPAPAATERIHESPEPLVVATSSPPEKIFVIRSGV